ncbi:MAG: cyaC [Chloroflexi bacterium]|jgi:CheY-like chemotaxis protein|nr:cyaC [Chloroflexota bacterium]
MAKVLVIDDEPSIATLVAEIIEGYGHQVYTAFNGLQGLDSIKQTRFDLIVSDIMMPHVTGHELLQFVRSHAGLAATPFVLMSAVSHLSRLDTDYEPDAFLVKPFDITRIDEVVQAFLPVPSDDESFKKTIHLSLPFKQNYGNSFLARE